MEGAAAAGEDESGAASRCTASTNWIVAGGSLLETISFDTSEEDAPAPAISTPLLLFRPPAAKEEDFFPCEVTICLNGMHEIHRIYVCSTARVYEIYYTADKQNNSKEYLCTVRCGIAAEEVTPLTATDVASAERESENYATSEKKDEISLADSNCSNEDGWVEVKVPDSPSDEHKINALPKQVDGDSKQDFQIYYEATADISDASPCMSVTLRFLSLQTKTCVHVSEIYIYADPVETANPGTPVGMGEKFGGSSLLAMFMPSLLQLSKSGASRQDNTLGVHKYQDGVQKAAEVSSSEMEITVPRGANSDKADHVGGLDLELNQLNQEYTSSALDWRVTHHEVLSCLADRELDQVEQSETKPENMQLGSSQKITDKEPFSSTTVQEAKARRENIQSAYSEKQIDPDRSPKSPAQENLIAGDHIEKILNELVSKVTKIEAFCSKFEERLMRPLSCIETRLEKLENLFHTFSSGDQIPQRGACSRISAPEFSSDEYDSEKRESYNSSSTSGDDDVFDNPSLPVDVTECLSVLAAGATASAPESRMHPGLVVTAPEFSNEDDECSQCDASFTSDVNCTDGRKLSSTADKGDECIKDGATLPLDLNCGEGKKLSSIDSALASALEGFLSSQHCHSMMEPYKLSTRVERGFNPSPARVLANRNNRSVDTLDEEKEEIAVDDSSLSSAAASEVPVRNSDWDSGCPISGILERSAALDDASLSADILISSLPPSLINSGLIFKAPEFPNDEDDFVNCGDTSEPNGNSCHEDQACIATDGESVSDLAAFLSLRKLKTSNCSTTSVAISSDPCNLEKNSFMVRVPCEVADGLYTQNHGNSIKDLVDFDINLPAETCLDHKPDKIEHCHCSMEVLLEGSSAIPLEHCLEERERQVKLDQCRSTLATASEDRLLTGDVCQSGSNCGVNKEQQGGLLNDSDDDQAEPDGPNLSQLGKRWSGSSSTFPSSVISCITDKDQVDCSTFCSMGSWEGASTVDQYSRQAKNENRSARVAMTCMSSQENFALSTNDSASGSYKSAAGYGHERTPNSASSHDDPILDVTFIQQRDWSSGVPLEILLGETSDAEVQDSAVADVTVDRVLGDQLLAGMEQLSVPADSSGLCDDGGGVEPCPKVNDWPN